MQTLETLLESLDRRAIRVRVEGDKLVVYPASQLTVEDREAIRHYKPQLLAAVKIAATNGNGTSQQHPNDEPSPQFCVRCLRILTATPEQLATHIDVVAQTLAAYGNGRYWPVAEFKARMVRELEPGDEIIMLGVGCVTVQRRNGALATIYRQAS
jgi:DNA-binding XRE family transcriptional regulator